MTEREAIKNEVLAIVAAAVRSEQCTSVGQWSASFARIAGFLESKITKEPLDLPTMTLDAAMAEIAKLNQTVAQKAESNRNMSDLCGRLQREVNEARIAMKFAREVDK